MKTADAAPTPTETHTPQVQPDERPWFDEPLDDELPPCLDDSSDDDGCDSVGSIDIDGGQWDEDARTARRRPRIWPPCAADEDRLDAATEDAAAMISLVHVDIWSLLDTDPDAPGSPRPHLAEVGNVCGADDAVHSA